MNKDEFKIIRLLHTNMASTPLPDQMKAQIINKHNKPYDFTTAPLPQIASDNDLLIKVEAAGYCHYDESLVHGHRKSEPKIFPHIGGHEIAGAVVLLLSAPLMCAGVTIFQAIKRCSLKPGQRLGVMGCGGGLGHLGLQFADAMRFNVLGVDAAVGPFRLAKSLGTNADIIDARETTTEQPLNRMREGKGDDETADAIQRYSVLPA